MGSKSDLAKAVAMAINIYSAENGSNTPDFILADFLTDVLTAYDHALARREMWYGRKPAAGFQPVAPPQNHEDHLKEMRSQGLIKKYHVTKADGSPVDPGAEYFCLRLDDGGSDPVHIAACRYAVLAYADRISTHLPKLAADLRMRYGPTA